ncbi:NAD-dependent epimerase/dehydratase family protein [Azospirillum sp. TSO22-1]|uniref:NAD-dependent epimerase/dehydratase family protein n=1 Tax=Azospirillum sp. TSO22-1 TaxID=716789 RepID=UPI000D617B70|nr:NAD-dependent epimerase/dehydratase family protein [Azospirillum sp. TSO22-1]PWC43861.1 NAD-dependent dehydratase [Azospirillum sp. TSO22-1]
MTRILVTGATGFVGRALVPLLVKRGFAVRAAVRHPDAQVPGADLVAVGDIGPDTDWAEALEGVDAVAHLAARVHVMRDTASDPLAEFRRTNTDGTRRLAEACAGRGVRRFVYLSSIKAVVDESRPDPVTDATPADPHSPYGISKREAEQALEDLHARGALDPVILRPPLVYGPGVAGNLRALLRLCRKRVPLPLGRVANRRSLIGVGNLADAVALCLSHPAAPGRTFLVSDGAPLSTADLVRHFSAGLGVRPRLLPVPPALLGLAAALLGRRDAWDRVGGSLVLDDAAIRAALGWSPPAEAASGLRATAEWFKASHG